MHPDELAQHNFDEYVCRNPYPGRGLVVGKSSDEASWLIVYWIMGRSTNSRNRRFVVDGNVLRTEPVDPRLVREPHLIIYEAMLETAGCYLVGNGDQVRTLYTTLVAGGTFDEAMALREREPDAPHYTPRISAMLDLQEPTTVTLSLLKASKVDPSLTDRFTFRPSLPTAGLGFGLTTYSGDANPLPSFYGEPLLLPCKGSLEEVLHMYWAGLNEENRVALAIKRIPVQGGLSEITVCNRFGN